MVKERTKFYNAYDKKNYMSDLMKEFLSMNSELPTENKPIPRRNVDLIYSINEYITKYDTFRRINRILFRFLEETEVFDKGFRGRYLNILKSCRRQFDMIYKCKVILKKVPVEQKYCDAIKYVLNDISKRLDYLMKNILPCYIEVTPLDNYVKNIGNEKFYDEIMELFPLVDKIEEEKLTEYVHSILSSYSGDGDWQKGLASYRKFLERKYAKLDAIKEEEALEKRKKRAAETEKMLISKSNNFSRLYMDGCVTYGYNRGVSNIGNRVADLKKKGRTKNKIVFLAKTAKGANANAFFLSLETEDNFTPAITKAAILEEHEPLPKQIQEKIENYEIAAVELMV